MSTYEKKAKTACGAKKEAKRCSEPNSKYILLYKHMY